MKDKCLKVFVVWALKGQYLPLRVTSYFALPSSLPNHVHIHMRTCGAGISFYSLPLTGKNMDAMRTCPILSHCWCYLWFMNKTLWWGDCGGRRPRTPLWAGGCAERKRLDLVWQKAFPLWTPAQPFLFWFSPKLWNVIVSFWDSLFEGHGPSVFSLSDNTNGPHMCLAAHLLDTIWE